MLIWYNPWENIDMLDVIYYIKAQIDISLSLKSTMIILYVWIFNFNI